MLYYAKLRDSEQPREQEMNTHIPTLYSTMVGILPSAISSCLLLCLSTYPSILLKHCKGNQRHPDSSPQILHLVCNSAGIRHSHRKPQMQLSHPTGLRSIVVSSATLVHVQFFFRAPKTLFSKQCIIQDWICYLFIFLKSFNHIIKTHCVYVYVCVRACMSTQACINGIAFQRDWVNCLIDCLSFLLSLLPVFSYNQKLELKV